MEGRLSKYRQVSPERSKIWTEKSPKYHYNHHLHHQNGKVPIVYYLRRNRKLEHPHFMEVPLSSPNGLYLRDVIERLNVLRGRGMASTYSWSYKRSYKNGFVWHDLCDDDLILPAHGNEYVLKGSELVEESNSGGFSPTGAIILQNQKALPEPPSSRSQEESSSSSSLNASKVTKGSPDDELSPTINRHCSLAMSPESSGDKNSSCNGSLTLAEYKSGLADASTQTDENATKIVKTRETCTRGVSTDEPENSGAHENETTSSASSSSGRTDTLESLIRADVKKIESFRILEEGGFRSHNTKVKASNLIMQLISCGSISVKDYSFGLIPSYRPSFAHTPFSTSSMFGDFDRMAENARLMSMRVEDKEYFSGSLVETSVLNEGVPVLKRSSSDNAESFKSSRTMTPSSSNPGSKRITEPRKKPEPSRNDDEKLIKIEERLSSGARVIIYSNVSSNNESWR